jgi:hypothetical protein
VATDYNNLRYFISKETKALTGRQARWAKDLSAFNFTIKYKKGILNPANGLSRRPNH